MTNDKQIVKIKRIVQKRLGDRAIVDMEKRSNKCLLCGKYYKYPAYVYEPRDVICFTCENKVTIGII